MESMESCAEKGCFSDPLSVKHMYFDLAIQPETGLVVRIHKGSTGKNESLHKSLNELVEHVARISAKLLHTRLSFRIFIHNESIDAQPIRSAEQQQRN